MPAPRPVDGFIQQEPHEGAAGHREDRRLDRVRRPERLRRRAAGTATPARSCQRDASRTGSASILQNDNFGVVFDTFHDRRNGFFFYTNAARRARGPGHHRRARHQSRLEHRLGGADPALRPGLDRRDGDPVQVAALRGARPPGLGHQAAARRARTNEISYLTPMPACLHAAGHRSDVSSAAHAGRPRGAPGGLNLELKPYASAACNTDLQRHRPFSERGERRRGLRREIRRHARPRRPTSRSTPTSRRSRSTSSR